MFIPWLIDRWLRRVFPPLPASADADPYNDFAT